MERKKNDLAKRCGQKSRTYMYIAPLKAIGHRTNQFFEKNSQSWLKITFFRGFWPSKGQKADFQAFFDSKKISRNFVCESKVVENMSGKLKNIPGCLETLLGCSGTILVKSKKKVQNQDFEHEIQLLEWNCLSMF